MGVVSMLNKQVSDVRAETLGARLWKISAMLMLTWLSPLSSAHAEDSPYLVQPGDILQVSVWRETDLQSEVLVRPDGGISFPLAGDMKVEGMSVSQISELITTKIQRYIPDPLVTVATKQIGGNHIYVIGKVQRAGEFSYIRSLDVMQALSLAGGATTFASLSDIRILRRVEGNQVAIRFDYEDVEKGKALNTNILLQSGDTVVVP